MLGDSAIAGIKCPQCGNEGRFRISCESIWEVTEQGVEGEMLSDGFEWEETSYCECSACHKAGVVSDFRITPAMRLKPLVAEYNRLMADRENSMEDNDQPRIENIDEAIDEVRETVFDIVAELFGEP